MGLFDLFKKKKTKSQNTTKSLFSGYRLLATLDTRTCLVCGELDGKVFDTSEAALSHICLNEHCRCEVLPVIKSMEDFDDDERASMDGPVSVKMTYAKWLKKQPAKRQKEILGESITKFTKRGLC